MGIGDFLTDRSPIGVSEMGVSSGTHPAVHSAVSDAVSNAIRDFARNPSITTEQNDMATPEGLGFQGVTDQQGNPSFNAGKAFGMFGNAFGALAGVSGMGTIAGLAGTALDTNRANSILSSVPNTQSISLASALLHNVTPFGLLGQSVTDQYLNQVTPNIDAAYAPYGNLLQEFDPYTEFNLGPSITPEDYGPSFFGDFNQLGADFGLDSNGGFGSNDAAPGQGASMGADVGMDANGGFGGMGGPDDNSGPGGDNSDTGGDSGDSGGGGGDGGGDGSDGGDE